MPTKLALACPRCQAPLAPRVFGSVTIDVCEACGGHWYDAGELERIRELGPTERPQDSPGVAPRWVDSKGGAITCPRCRMPLATERYAYSSDLVLDRCENCNGVWVDAGELDRMDQLVNEWSRELEKDQVVWGQRLGEMETALGHRLDSAARPGRMGALVGFLWDKLRGGRA